MKSTEEVFRLIIDPINWSDDTILSAVNTLMHNVRQRDDADDLSNFTFVLSAEKPTDTD